MSRCDFVYSISDYSLKHKKKAHRDERFLHLFGPSSPSSKRSPTVGADGRFTPRVKQDFQLCGPPSPFRKSFGTAEPELSNSTNENSPTEKRAPEKEGSSDMKSSSSSTQKGEQMPGVCNTKFALKRKTKRKQDKAARKRARLEKIFLQLFGSTSPCSMSSEKSRVGLNNDKEYVPQSLFKEKHTSGGYRHIYIPSTRNATSGAVDSEKSKVDEEYVPQPLLTNNHTSGGSRSSYNPSVDTTFSGAVDPEKYSVDEECEQQPLLMENHASGGSRSIYNPLANTTASGVIRELDFSDVVKCPSVKELEQPPQTQLPQESFQTSLSNTNHKPTIPQKSSHRIAHVPNVRVVEKKRKSPQESNSKSSRTSKKPKTPRVSGTSAFPLDTLLPNSFDLSGKKRRYTRTL